MSIVTGTPLKGAPGVHRGSRSSSSSGTKLQDGEKYAHRAFTNADHRNDTSTPDARRQHHGHHASHLLPSGT